jgi:tRNA threonylcarbamoyl adenosine modification protein YeaZ
VAEVMAAAGTSWSDLDLIATTLGPGTYTGIRAGLAAARGLALATGLPALGVSSLEALAACAPEGQALTVVIGGRGETVFVQRFDADGHPLDDPRATERSTLDRHVGLWLEDEEAVDGVAVARAALRALKRGAVPGPGPTLRPLYLREPDLRADAGRPLVGAAA